MSKHPKYIPVLKHAQTMDKNTIPHINREAEEEDRRSVAEKIRRAADELAAICYAANNLGLSVEIRINTFSFSNTLPAPEVHISKVQRY